MPRALIGWIARTPSLAAALPLPRALAEPLLLLGPLALLRLFSARSFSPRHDCGQELLMPAPRVHHRHNRNWERYRSPSALERQHRSSHRYTSAELADLAANNLLVISSWMLLARWLGAGLFWSSYALVMVFSAAICICIFCVQPNCEANSAHGSADWNQLRSCHERNAPLLDASRRLRRADIPSCCANILWDDSSDRLLLLRQGDAGLSAASLCVV